IGTSDTTEWAPAPHRPPGADDDGRIPRERRIPEELKEFHRRHPERARRDARAPALRVRGRPRAGRARSARAERVVLSGRPSPRVNHTRGPARPDEAREALASSESGDDADVYFGLAQFRANGGDPDVAGQGEFTSASEGESIDRGDDWFIARRHRVSESPAH